MHNIYIQTFIHTDIYTYYYIVHTNIHKNKQTYIIARIISIDSKYVILSIDSLLPLTFLGLPPPLVLVVVICDKSFNTVAETVVEAGVIEAVVEEEFIKYII